MNLCKVVKAAFARNDGNGLVSDGRDMERETGIEPATSSLGSWRSTAELLPLDGTRVSPGSAGHNPARVREFAEPFVI